MNNLKINKDNVKKVILGLGIGGVIIATSLTGIMNKGIDNDFISDIIYSESNINNQYTKEEFTKMIDDIYNNSEVLQTEWKDFYPEIKDFVSKYGESLDQETILEKLPNLTFINDATLLNDKRMAEYSNEKNSITYSKRLPNKKQSEIKSIKLHESLHFFFQKGFRQTKGNYQNTGWMLDEGTVSLIVQEYDCYDGGDNYEKASYYVRTIMEIVGSDNYIDIIGKKDLNALIDSLSTYCTKGEAKDLINNIDKASSLYEEKGTEYDINAWNIIKKIYKNKNGIELEESKDEIMKIYSNKTADTMYPITGAEYSFRASANKRYIVNNDINSIIIEKDNNNVEIKLDENNKAK
ncbi:MAG: hypothetical protein IKH54_00755 [Bacilli bacterium]|nr:hypothetical protein [Bacilli bacterium]